MTDIRWLLFDLGLLAEFSGAQRLEAWMRRPVREWELQRLWLFSPAVRAFESGEISPLIFACEAIREFGLDVHPDAFLKEFVDFAAGFYPGAGQMLEALSAGYSLALLSNTNSLHWEKLRGISDIGRLFRHCFLSFKTGFLKPGREAYRNAIDALQCAPEEMLLFDGNPDCVRGALDAGMRAQLIGSFGGLRETVGKMGLL
jgi:glucose-1-phosphatase